MKKHMINGQQVDPRNSERGAAMVTVLLVSFLLLVGSAGLILEAALNSANVTDAVSEQQAYHAAESGIQRTLDVLRGNVVPSVLLDGSESAGHINNQIDFTKAVTPAFGNLPTDSSTVSRLSRWIAYDGTMADRVALGPNPAEYAYSIEVIDPDNAGAEISFVTTSNINGNGSSYTFGSDGNTATIAFAGRTVNDLNTSSGSAASDLGQFVISTTGTGATLPDDIRFAIDFRMTKPYAAVRSVRGTIRAGTISSNSVGTVQMVFDSLISELMGSEITLTSRNFTPNPPNTSGGAKDVEVTITGAEPVRLIVKSTGFGPRGSTKQLEAFVRKSLFDGMRAPATLTLVGDQPGFTFNPGSSNVSDYSGEDVAVPDTVIPPIGTTNGPNLDVVQNSIDGNPPHPFNGDVIGNPANVNSEMPAWLASPSNLDSVVQALREVAQLSGRYFPSGVTPSNFGDNVNATGITFCDGDLTFSGAGGGIMIVTGKLTLSGNFNFNGLILVTGPQGIDRSGGGTGTLQGNVVVAPYDPSNLGAPFGAPQYDLSGGGNSTITYNSSSLSNGLVAVSNFVLGVAEK
ncbi:MAG TPA: hypothetical protein VMM38_13780 [Aridibacter sp.]|nr:hypothetical protein [Aridibacter sp.]